MPERWTREKTYLSSLVRVMRQTRSLSSQRAYSSSVLTVEESSLQKKVANLVGQSHFAQSS